MGAIESNLPWWFWLVIGVLAIIGAIIIAWEFKNRIIRYSATFLIASAVGFLADTTIVALIAERLPEQTTLLIGGFIASLLASIATAVLLVTLKLYRAQINI